MYEAIADPDCYKGTTVLKNRQRLRDQAALDRFETAIVFQRANEPLPDGVLGVRHYCAIHRHLFQDVCRWAGRFRTVRLIKDDSVFCYPENIRGEMRRLFASLRAQTYLRGLPTEDFVARATRFLAELNAIHPFREGNGRSQMTFMALLGHRAGHPLSLARLAPGRFLAAMVRSFKGDEGPLVAQLTGLIRRREG
jgi:cell filamentation protein